MSASPLPPPPPPSDEDIGEHSAEKIREAIKTLEMMTFPKDQQLTVRVAIRAMRILVEVPGLLALAPLVRRLHASVHGRTP